MNEPKGDGWIHDGAVVAGATPSPPIRLLAVRPTRPARSYS